MKRLFDIIFALLLMLILFIPVIILAILVKLTSKGPVFYMTDRVGIDNTIFKMFKFRTMRIDTPPVATHLMTDSKQYLTPVGGFFRKLSLDEIPQLINILKGDMSFVGPRPALFNQDDLTELRTNKGVHKIIVGLTGWAQVNGRDELPIPVKVDYDEHYLHHRSFLFDIKIIFLTLIKALRKEGVQH